VINLYYSYPLCAKGISRLLLAALIPGVITILCHGSMFFPSRKATDTYLNVLSAQRISLETFGFPFKIQSSIQTAAAKGAAPEAHDDNATTREEVPISFDVLKNDKSGNEGKGNDDDDKEDDKPGQDGLEDNERKIDPSTVDLDPDIAGLQQNIFTSNGSFAVSQGIVTFSPVKDFFGDTDIQYTVNSEGGETSNAATISVTVTNVNDAPVINGALGPVNATAGVAVELGLQYLRVSDVDNETNDLSMIILPGTNYKANQNTVTPDPSFSGELPVHVQVSDGDANSNAFDIILRVSQKANEAPVITGQNPVTTSEDDPVEIDDDDLVISDPDDNDFTINVRDGNNYSVNGRTVAPAQDFYGTLSVPVSVSDGENTSNVFSLQITVSPVNDPPVITGAEGPVPATAGSPVVLGLQHVRVSDPDNATNDLTLKVLPGTNYREDGNTVTPDASFSGNLPVHVQVTDGRATSNTVDIILSVTQKANQAPVITGQRPVTTSEDDLVRIEADQLTISDPDDDNFTVNVADGENYTVNGKTVAPAPNFYGMLTVPVSVSDGKNTSSAFPLKITVNPVNDPPVINGAAGPVKATAGSPVALGLQHVRVSDPDNSTNDLAMKVLPGANYRENDNTVTPDPTFSGELPVHVQVTDGNATSNTFDITLSVAQKKNEPPTITGQNAVSTSEDEAVRIDEDDLIISDADDDDFTVQVGQGDNYTVNGTTVTPAENFYGTLTVPVTVNDGENNSNVFQFQITVTSVNDEPVITGQNPDPIATGNGQSVTISLGNIAVTDVDHSYPQNFVLTVEDGDDYTVSGTTITPDAGFSGMLGVKVTVADPAGATDKAVLRVSVAGNTAPVITGQTTLGTNEEAPLAITLSNLTVSDPDDAYPSGFSLRLSDGDNYSVNGDVITPALNFAGTLTVPVVVNDGSDDSSPFNLSITVNAVNDAPVITGQVALSTQENQPIQLQLGHLTVTDPDDAYPSGFTLSILGGSNYTVSGSTITPATGYNGSLTVRVFVNDGEANSNFFDVTINVTPINDTPQVTGQRALSVAEGSSLSITLADLTVSDSDNSYPDDFRLIVLPGDNYSVSSSTVTPSPDFTGVLTVNVAVNDGVSNSATFPLQITVTPVNDPPAITGHQSVSTNEDTPRAITTADLIISDPDNSGGFTLTVFPGDNYTLSGNTIIPSPDYSGSLSVQVQVSDGALTSNVHTLPVQVLPVNDAPVITGQVPIQTAEDTPVTLQLSHLTVFDVDNTYPAGFTLLVSPGANYSVSGTTITPTVDFNGTLNIAVSVNDGGAASQPFNFQIQVGDANDAPVITGQSAVTTDEEKPVTLALTHLTVSDPDNAYPTGFSLLVSPGLNYSVAGTTITPALNFAGELTIPVRVNDGVNNSASFDFKLQVNQVNDAPSFAAIANQTVVENSPAGSVTITEISKGPMEDYQQLTFVANSSNTAVIADPVIQYNGTGSTAVLSYAIKPNASGVVTLTVVAIDNGSNTPPNQNSYTSSFQVQVVEVNAAPTLNAISNLNVMEDAEQQNVSLSGISAGPGETQTIAISVTSNKPEFFDLLQVQYTSPAQTGVLQFKTKPNVYGTATLSVTVTDNGSSVSPNVNSITRSFSVVIQPVNDPPVFTSQPVVVAGINEPYEYRIRVTDPDGDKLTISAPAKPAWATLTSSSNGEARLQGRPPQGSVGNTPVRLQVTDGGAVVEQTFNIYVNVRPVLANLTLATEEDTPAALPANFFAAGYTDVNDNPMEEIVITRLPTSGYLFLGDREVATGDTISSASISQLRYAPHENFFGMDSFGWNASDGYQYSSASARVDISVLSINDPPMVVLESDTLRYEVNGEHAFLSPLLEIVDPDDDTLTHATIGFYDGYRPDMEVLDFQATANIRGTFDFQTGMVQFTGAAPVEEYTTALRSVRYLYQNTIDPILESKTVYYILHDGQVEGEPVDKLIVLQYTFIEFTIPSGFTPNGDNANDTWVIDRPGGGLEEMQDAIISVYNKQGVLVHRAKGFDRPWDGTMNGTQLPADTYFFTIDLQLRSQKTYKGIVTILR